MVDYLLTSTINKHLLSILSPVRLTQHLIMNRANYIFIHRSEQIKILLEYIYKFHSQQRKMNRLCNNTRNGMQFLFSTEMLRYRESSMRVQIKISNKYQC